MRNADRDSPRGSHPRKNSNLSAIAILTIAIGIAANTAIFSVVNGVLLRPLPFHERIVQVWTATNDESRSGHSAGDFLDLQRENRSFTAMAGYRNAIFAVMVGDRDPQQFEGNWVTVDFFDILGVRPAAGRVFSRAQDATPAEPMVVISDAVWQRVFNGSQDAVGTRVRLNGEPHTVVGVMPPRAEWPEVSKLWILSGKPVPPSPVDVQGSNVDRDVRYFEAIARLKPGVSLEQAADDMGAWAPISRSVIPRRPRRTPDAYRSDTRADRRRRARRAARPSGGRRPRAAGRLRERFGPARRARHRTPA